jgi:hypothetical protein
MRILFLGAGFSKAMGLPLTADLLPAIVKAAEDNWLFEGLGYASDKRRLLLDLIAELFPQAAARVLPSIVDLLSLIDYALAEGFTVLQTGGAERLRRSRALLEAGLIYVLSNYSNSTDDKLRVFFSHPETCVITTNYDFLPDGAIKRFLSANTPIDYGMPWRDVYSGTIWQRPTKPAFRLFKLHGSLNWLGCPSCEHIYINRDGVIAVLGDEEDNQFKEEVTCHCGYWPLRPVIVSPSLSRGTYQSQLRSIHLAALEALHAAKEIYIVGYSLPIEDLMIRSLFMRSSSNQSSKRTVKIFQVSEEAHSRYDMHFANYEYLLSGFDGFLELLSRLGTSSPTTST